MRCSLRDSLLDHPLFTIAQSSGTRLPVRKQPPRPSRTLHAAQAGAAAIGRKLTASKERGQYTAGKEIGSE